MLFLRIRQINTINLRNLPPQDQLRILDGSQYAALAKFVKGRKAAISVAERVVIPPCLRITSEGAANTLRADKSPTAKVAVYMAKGEGKV